MAASILDSALYHDLFDAGPAARLFTDSAELRAMLLVEGALAEAQGQIGLIPETAAAYIHRAAREVQIDPTALAPATGRNGVSVPALVAAFRKEMNAPEHAQYLHWGATSQDIIDTALALRLRQFLALMAADLDATLAALGPLARAHATLPMPARTYGQHATVTSFGAVIASWGRPLIALAAEVGHLRAALRVSLSGAAGTSAALGPQAQEIRARMAAALGLAAPAHSWHAERNEVQALAAWATRLATSLGRMGEDVILLAQSGIDEIMLEGAGASSTMPQKQNPVGASVMVALARHAVAMNGLVQGAGLHRQQRDGTAWFAEWLGLPPLLLGTAAALGHASRTARATRPRPVQMAQALASGLGLIHAEALTFRLCQTLPRPEAQAAVKSLCQRAMDEQQPLAALAAEHWPELDLAEVFDPQKQMGLAPQEARDFADQVAARLGNADSPEA